ncbi:MAG TPA: M23 family metallopeptidase [Acidimicrobiia bacterium]
MHSRVLKRVFVLVVAVVAGVGVATPALTARAATEPPFEVVFPQEISKTYFSSSYGDYRSGGRRHKGNDLMAPRLTEVYAVADGIVFHVGINRLSGRNLKVDHGGGWESYYLHLNNDNPGTDDGDAPWSLTVAPGIEEGTAVKAGQLIGWVGDSGNAEGTAPHTHFELHRDGYAINPYSILRDSFERELANQQYLEMLLTHDTSTYPVE